jgi:hypothetical protein
MKHRKEEEEGEIDNKYWNMMPWWNILAQKN